MPITVDWGDMDETIIVWKFHFAWTVDDFRHAMQRTVQLKQQVGHDIYVICDLRPVLSYPPNLVTLALEMTKRYPEAAAITVVITPNEFWPRVFQLFQRVAPRQFQNARFVRQVDEAYEYITSLQQKDECDEMTG